MKLTYHFYWILLLPILSCQQIQSQNPAAQQQEQASLKPRVIVTTDGEFDDRCSMVRFLLYANEFDIQGIIHSSSKFHWKGNDSIEAHQWQDVSWIDRHLEAYAEVYPNLLKHDPSFPTPEYLRKQIFEGNIEAAGEMEKDTEGAQRIVEVLTSPDPQPVWLQAWGGSNTIARALKTIEEKHPEKKQQVEEKARLFLILLQDSTYENYIATHWPDMQVILSTSFEAIGYPWRKRVSEPYSQYYLGAWMNQNLLFDHGPLLDIYQDHLYGGERTSGDFISEGDSPAFMHSIPNGLHSNQDPSWGGWGGRFQWKDSLWVSAPDDGDIFKTVYRWIPDYQKDFAARADWCIKSFEEANHPPTLPSDAPKTINAKAGSSIPLSVQGATDPDGDALEYLWWQYAEADSYQGSLKIENTETSSLELQIPADAQPGDDIHMICTVSDSGTPSLARYQRFIISID